MIRASVVPTVLILLAGCGGADKSLPPAGATKPASSAPAPQQAAAAKPAEAAKPVPYPKDQGTAAVAGKITFTGKGEAEWSQPIDMSTHQDCAKLHGDKKVNEERLVVGANGELANVLVFVSQGAERYTFEPAKEPVALNQTGCRYEPHVFGVMVDQPIKITNSDATVHSIHAWPKKNADFNFTQAKQGQVDEKSFDTAELPVPIRCDVHPWMQCYAAVFEHPWFAVTKADGSFEIGGLVPGPYTLTFWHEKLGQQTQTFEASAGQKAQLSVVFAGK